MRNRKFLIQFVCFLAVAIAAPLVVRGAVYQHIMIMIMVWAILGMGWNFLGGYAGQVSTGHAVYYAIGTYTVALGMKNFYMSPWLSMWLGVLISCLLAFFIGKPLLRLKGHFFAVATMAVAECMRVIFLNLKPVGAASGISFNMRELPQWFTLQFMQKIPFYYVMLFFAVLILLLTKALDHSKFGYYLRAIRENELSAESVGIPASNYKLYAYLLSAAVVSLGGSLYINYLQYVDPTMVLILPVSLMICLVSVMGGNGTVWGPFIGAVVLTTISEYTKARFSTTLNGFDMFLYGLLVIIIVLALPKGLISLIGPQSRNKIRRFLKR